MVTKKTKRQTKKSKPASRGASKKAKKKMSTATRRVSETLIATVADQLLTLSEAAERLGCSQTYLRWLCNFRHDTHVPFARKVGRNWFVPESRLADIPLENKGITGRPPGSGRGRPRKSGAKKARGR